MKKRSTMLIRKRLHLLMLFCLVSVALSAQSIFTDVINDNINWEFRITQTQWTAGTTDILDPDATPIGGSVPDHEPSFLIGAATSSNNTADQVNSGSICIQSSGVPPVNNYANTLIKSENNTAYSGIDVDFRSWEDDGGDRCGFESGDDNFMRTQKYYNNPIDNPGNGVWTVESESFSNGSSINAQHYWHYTNGNTLGNPLQFGEISGTTKSHINQNSSAPSGISVPANFEYANNYDAVSALQVNGQSSNDVYYQFTINSPQIVTISTNNFTTDFDTYIHLLDGGGNHLASNDNASGTTKSELILQPLCSGSYSVVVEGKGGATGTFQLIISASAIAPFDGGEVANSGSETPGYGYALPPINNVSLPSTTIDLNYQWLVSEDGGPWIPLPGKTDPDLSEYGFLTSCTMAFRRKAYACGNSIVRYSNTITFRITGTGNVSIRALEDFVALGEPIPGIYTITYTDLPSTYQWQEQKTTTWADLPGETDLFSITGEYLLENPSQKYRLAANLCGTDYYSNEVTIRAYPSYESGGPIYVKKDATGSNSGANWDDAHTNLQDAIDEAEATGAEIWVAAGTYRPTLDPSGNPGGIFSTFLISENIQIYGGFAGTETMRSQRNLVTNRCILSGDLYRNDQPGLAGADLLSAPSRADNALHILILDGLSDEFVLDGFEIRGGNYYNTAADNIGGGAIWMAAGSSFSAPNVKNCDFYDNASFEYGGAIFHQTSDGMSFPQFYNCNFKNNYAMLDGGAFYNDANKLDGSGTASPTFLDCRFEFNSAGKNGGAIFSDATNGISRPNLTKCWFIGNSAAEHGGAIENYGSAGEGTIGLLNTVFIDNTAGFRGGALYNLVNISGVNSEIVNCSFYNNQAGVQGGVIYNVSGISDVGRLMIFNSILWNNGTQEIIPLRNSGSGTVTINNSIFDDGTIDNSAPVLPFSFNGSNNLDSDPLFFRPQGGDLRITGASPAVNAGDNTAPGLNNLSVDLESNPRIIGGTVDMGAYENGCELLGDKLLVDIDAPGPGDGQSWGTAFPDLQQGIEAACLCDKPVWVAEGTYYPTVMSSLFPSSIELDNYKKTFYIDRNVQIYGGFSGTETLLTERDHEAHPTILSGNFDASEVDALKVLYLDGTQGNPITPDCMINGFTIEGGNANFAGWPGGSGGGMFNDGSGSGNECSPTIAYCNFVGNRSIFGGGAIYNYGSSLGRSSPVITHCFFENNQSPNGGAIFNQGGGGESSPILTDCIFENNQASLFGGAIFSRGESDGGVSSPALDRCEFYYNQAYDGGAVYNQGDDGGKSFPAFINCYFGNNQASGFGGAMVNIGHAGAQIASTSFQSNLATEHGGAIYERIPSGLGFGSHLPGISDCSFIDNIAGGDGGALYTERDEFSFHLQVKNTRFINNQALDGGAVRFYVSDKDLMLDFVNCLFSGNIASQAGSALYTYALSESLQTRFINTTFAGNSTDNGTGGTIYNGLGTLASNNVAVINSILWDDELSMVNEAGVTASLNYSILNDGSPDGTLDLPSGVSGANNSDLDPLFVDAQNGDFHLFPSSPGIDAGDDAAIPVDITTDLAGNDRIANNGVDIGAYENELVFVSAVVTFRVDMSRETVSPDGVHVAGNFQAAAGFGSDWDPAATLMTDPDNDQIYEVTVELVDVILGSPFEYKFINGNAWGTDEQVPLDCAVGINRQFFLENTDQTLPLVCFGRCLACTEECRSILDFESSSTSGDFQYFSNNALDNQTVPVVANPAPDAVNSNSTVLAFTKTAGASTFAGAFSDLDPGQALDLTASDQLSVRVLMDHPGNITLKLEASTTGGSDWIQTVENDVINEWTRLYFDLGQNSLEPPFEPATGQAYSRLVLFPDFGYPGTDADVVTYFDNFILCANRNGGGGDNCDGIDLTLGDGSLPSDTYRAETSITSSNSVEPGETVVFTAGESIRLTAGFHAKPESNFTAMIADCTPSAQPAPLVQSVPAENSVPVGKNIDLSVFPNPTRYGATLEFNLPDQSPVSLEVYHGTGVLTKRLLDGEILDPGIHQQSLTTGSLESGIYYIVLYTAEQRVTKKLMVLE